LSYASWHISKLLEPLETDQADIRAARPEMEWLFVEFGVPVPSRIRLDQPCVAYHFALD
jgi:hypothetical protein